MSANVPRGRGGNVVRGSRGSTTAANTSSRGTFRGRQATSARGSTRGVRGASGQGLLQQLRTGTVARGGHDGGATPARGRGVPRATTSIRGRGRGTLTKTFNTTTTDSVPQSLSSSPAQSGTIDVSSSARTIEERHTHLKSLRDEERKEAIRQGVLADPDERTTLDKAITPVGTCEDMCPIFERVERIRENMVDRCEKITNPDNGKHVPSEEIMVKRFKRSDAGADAQIPSDIRTPKTLLKTLNYLIDRVIGGPERLAVVHKFVWDRTRSIRNDFSIQQVSRTEDVKIAVECFERIARFHIMSLHQLSNPDNLHEDENFDVHQEREQLNNTILSLMYYYDDYRDQVDFPNEPEIRSYHMIMAIQPQYPDLEDRIQSWPAHIIADARVQTALRLYQAAGDTLFYQGPLMPRAPCPVARNNSGNFFTIMSTGAVSYNLACVAEIYFNQVRMVALECLLVSAKSASLAQQQKSRDWSLDAVTEHLGFDTEQQTIDFCAAFSLAFATDKEGVTYLDIAAYGRSDLDQSALPKQHTFSHTFVEEKRCRRTLQAIINNVSPADAIRQGMIEPAVEDEDTEVQDDGQSLFIPESNLGVGQQAKAPSFVSGMFNPEASAFAPSTSFGTPATATAFGASAPSTSFGASAPSTAFGGSAPSTSFGASGSTGSQAFGAANGQTENASFGVSKKFGEAAPSASTQQKPFSTSFGQSFGASQTGSSAFSTSFGQSSTAKSPFGQTPSFPTNLAAETDQAQANATGEKLPNHIAHFGTLRRSNTENNPFGEAGWAEKAAQAAKGQLQGESTAPGSTFSPSPGLGANAGSTSNSATTAPAFNFGTSFGKPSIQEAQSTPSSFPTLSTPAPEPEKPKTPFAGFNFTQSAQTSEQNQSQSPTTVAPSIGKGATEDSKPFSFFSAPSQPSTSPSPAETTNQTPQPSFALPKTPFEFPKATSQTTPAFTFNESEQPASIKQTSQAPQTAGTSSPVAAPAIPSTASPISTPKLPLGNNPQPSFTFAPPSAKTQAPPPPSQNPLASFQSSTQTQTSSPKTLSHEVPSLPDTPSAPSTFAPQTTSSAAAKAVQPTPQHDKAQLTDRLVRLSLEQEHGLIREYLEFALPKLLQKVLRDHQAEKFREAISRIKTNYLSRKYGSIWRGIAWRKNLNKRANKRRQNFAESVRMEAEKKKRSEKELEMILKVGEESKRIQAEMQRRQATANKERELQKAEQPQIAGSKRKSFAESTATTPKTEGTSRFINHKRSRTIGGMQPPPTPNRVPQTGTTQDFRHSIFSPRSSLNRSTSGSNLRQSVLRAKQDDTKTDYFRLLANGIDPDTPLVPLTARQVEAKERKDREEREAAVARAHNRRRVNSTAPRGSQSVTSATTSPAASPQPAPTVPSPTPSASRSVYDPQTDDLLQQLREARLALENDTTWFKEQASKIEKEAQEEERLRSSTSSHPSPQVGHGLTIVDGHAYSPAPPQSMSRVEARIRRLGSKLAYKPVGQQSERVSRQSSLRYSSDQHEEEIEQEIETNGTAKKRRRRGDIDRSYRPSKDDMQEDEEDLDMSPQKRIKNNVIPTVRHTLPAKAPAPQYNPASNRFAFGDEEEQSEEDILGDGEDEEYYQRNGVQGIPHQQYLANAILGDDEEDYDEEDLEEDDEEGEEDDSDDEGYAQGGYVSYPNLHQQSSHLYGYEEAATPNTQATSRATSSGPGATVEDALVLSDSD